MERLWCYAPQARTVRTLLEPFMAIGRTSLVPVDDTYVDRMRGHEGGTFVMVTGHSARIPDQIHREIAIMGYTVWHIDDSHRRARAIQKRNTS